MPDLAPQDAPAIAPPPVPLDQPGARPLRNPAHERYARNRALLLPRVEAYRQAGLGGEDYHADRGNAAKLERKQAVADRIAHFGRQDEDLIKLKRARLESFLWAAHETNYADFWETVEEPEYVQVYDEDGNPTGQTTPTGNTRQRQRVRNFGDLTEDQQRMIESLKYTEKGRPILLLYNRMQANIELRKMLGIGATQRDTADGEFSSMPDNELFATIAREAKELGVDMEFTFKVNGAAA